MYDSPKAAHFDAYDEAGTLLPAYDPIGLAARWAAAYHVARDVTSDMRDTAAAARIPSYLDEMHGRLPCTVKLRPLPRL